MNKQLSWSTFDEHNLAHQALRDFLQLDIQQNPPRIEALLNTITQIQAGEIEDWHGGGNTYFCQINRQGAQLEIAVDDVVEAQDEADIDLIPLECFIAATTAWLQCCI